MLATLGGGFSSILLQLSFPAALQLISIFIPLVYVLKQSDQLKRDIFSRRRVVVSLAIAVSVSVLLYLGSVMLLVTQNASLDRDIPLMASSVPIVDIVVILILGAFLLIPVYFFWDMWKDLRLGDLPESDEPSRDTVHRSSLETLANNHQIMHTCKQRGRSWLGVIDDFQIHLDYESPSRGFGAFERFLKLHHGGLREVAIQTLRRLSPHHKPQDPLSVLAEQFMGNLKSITHECMANVYGRRSRLFIRTFRRSRERMQMVARALAAAALIRLKDDLDQIKDRSDSTRAPARDS